MPFFAAALAGFAEAATQRIGIHDARAGAFRAVWHFIYTDDGARVEDLGAEDLLDALALSHRFELAALQQRTEWR